MNDSVSNFAPYKRPFNLAMKKDPYIVIIYLLHYLLALRIGTHGAFRSRSQHGCYAAERRYTDCDFYIA